MNLFDKLKSIFKNSTYNEWLRGYMAGDSVGTIPPGSSMIINSTTAMTYSAVFACVKVLSETFACLPAMVYKTLPNGDRERVTNINVYDILHNIPNEEMSPFNFYEAMMTSLCLGGNAFAQKLKNKRGDVIGLYPLEWQKVRIDRDKEIKKLIYIVTVDNQQITYTKDDIFHIPGLSLNGINGLSPIGYEAKAIELGLQFENFSNNFYKKGATPSGVVEIPTELNDEAFMRFKTDFNKNYAGMVNQGVPMVLEGGLKYTPLTIKQSDAQFLESRRFQTEEIARIFRVPLHLIQDLQRSTNNNIEQQSLEFVMYTMLPWVKRWEENINCQILTAQERKAGIYVEFNINSLLRGDMKSRAESYAIARQWGWLSVNDIRKLENMNPVENGDIYLTPLNMIEAGTEIDKSVAPAVKNEAGIMYFSQKGGQIIE